MSPRYLPLITLVAVTLGAFHFSGSAVIAQSRPTRTVLTINWSSEDFPGTDVINAAVQRALRSDPSTSVDFFAEYLESDQFSPQQASVALRDYIKQKFSGRHIDVVVAISDPSLDFALRYRAELFPDAPIVASISSPLPRETSEAGAGVTGIFGGAAYDQTLDLALRLHPTTKRVFVVAHAPTLKFSETVRRELQAFSERVEMTFIDESSVDRLLAAITAIPPDSLVLFVRHSQSEPGDVLYPAQVARLVSNASPVPVYGINESYIGSGIVGGVVKSWEPMGNQIGQIARQVLTGTRARDVVMQPVPLTPIVDWRQLSRWRISPMRLPAGTDVRFRELTAWQQYGFYFLTAVAVVAVQSTLIAALLVQQRRRRRAEFALRHARAELDRVSRLTALGEFAAAIAHEVRQPLQAIVVTATSCLHRLAATPPDVNEVRAGLQDVLEAGQWAGQVISRNRELFKHHSLTTATTLDLNGVIQEAIGLVRARLTEQQIALFMTLDDTQPVIVGDRIELQQVLLNLFANAIDAMDQVDRHGRRVHVVSTHTEDGARVSITDTGVGLASVDMERMFSLSYTTKPQGTGVGLSISRSIVEAHGGRLWGYPAPGGGATFCFTLPRAGTAIVPSSLVRI